MERKFTKHSLFFRFTMLLGNNTNSQKNENERLDFFFIRSAVVVSITEVIVDIRLEFDQNR